MRNMCRAVVSHPWVGDVPVLQPFCLCPRRRSQSRFACKCCVPASFAPGFAAERSLLHELSPHYRVNVYDVSLPFGLSIRYLYRTAIEQARVLDNARSDATETFESVCSIWIVA